MSQSIVCFAKDWNEVPTSNNHVMLELAKHNRVLWLNSVSTRKPNLRSGRDIRKIFRKLSSVFSGAEQVSPGMWVYTPIVLPFPHSAMARRINRLILKASIKRLARKLKMDDFELWTFLPNVVDYLDGLGASVLVYYCVDEWSRFSYIDGENTVASEQRLCKKADIVFATATSLVERRVHLNPETHLAAHGVDYQLFSKAVVESTPVPDDLSAISQPILGFYGTIQDWVDLDLLAYLAERHPEWSIVLIGDILVDVSKLRKYRNVHLLGRRPHSALPNYCKGFSIGLIPQKVNDLTRHMNPIKLREYLSAGLPVVSTALPEVSQYRHCCHIARDYGEFERGVIKALSEDSQARRAYRCKSMESETWERKVAALSAHVDRVKGRLCTSK